jgi:hypothetical protein
MSKKFKKLALLGLTVLTAQGLSADEDTTTPSSGVNVDSEVLLAAGCASCRGGRKASSSKGGEIADNDYRPSYQSYPQGGSYQSQSFQAMPANQAIAPQPYTTYGCSANKASTQGRRYYSDANQMPTQNGCEGGLAPQPTTTTGCQAQVRPDYSANGTSWASPYADNAQVPMPTTTTTSPTTWNQDTVIQGEPQPTATPSGNFRSVRTRY